MASGLGVDVPELAGALDGAERGADARAPRRVGRLEGGGLGERGGVLVGERVEAQASDEAERRDRRHLGLGVERPGPARAVAPDVDGAADVVGRPGVVLGPTHQDRRIRRLERLERALRADEEPGGDGRRGVEAPERGLDVRLQAGAVELAAARVAEGGRERERPGPLGLAEAAGHGPAHRDRRRGLPPPVEGQAVPPISAPVEPIERGRLRARGHEAGPSDGAGEIGRGPGVVRREREGEPPALGQGHAPARQPDRPLRVVAEPAVPLERPVGARVAAGDGPAATKAPEDGVVAPARERGPDRRRPIARDHVDDGAHGRVAPQRRRPAAHDLDALHSVESDELPVHDAGLDVVEGPAVEEHEDVLGLAAAVEPADGRGRRRPGPVAAQERDPGREREHLGQGPDRPARDLVCRHDLDGGRRPAKLDGHPLGRDRHAAEAERVGGLGEREGGREQDGEGQAAHG